eukprot:403332089
MSESQNINFVRTSLETPRLLQHDKANLKSLQNFKSPQTYRNLNFNNYQTLNTTLTPEQHTMSSGLYSQDTKHKQIVSNLSQQKTKAETLSSEMIQINSQTDSNYPGLSKKSQTRQINIENTDTQQYLSNIPNAQSQLYSKGRQSQRISSLNSTMNRYNQNKTNQSIIYDTFVEINDLDKFFTKVLSLPEKTQYKVLQEKIKSQQNKIINIEEELECQQEQILQVKDFLSNLSKDFVKGIFQTDEEALIYKDQLGIKIQQLDFTLKRNLQNIQFILDTQNQPPSSLNLNSINQSTIESLNNNSQKSVNQQQQTCLYHKAKIRKLIKDLNDQIELNLKVKEQNMKLKLLNQSLGDKLEDKNLLIKQHVAGSYLNKKDQQQNYADSALIKSPKKRGTVVFGYGQQPRLTRRVSQGSSFFPRESSNKGIDEQFMNQVNEKEIILNNQYNLCLKLMQSVEHHSETNNFDKVLLEISKEIESIYDVEKCIILKVSGKELTDGREYKIPNDEGLFEDLKEEQRPIIVNDISKDKNMQKDLNKQFKLKVMNLMYLPVIQKKKAPQNDGLSLKQVDVKSSTVRLHKDKQDQEYQNFQTSDCPAFKTVETWEKEQEDEKKVIQLIDNILQYPNMRRFTEEVESSFANLFGVERANLVIVDRFKKDLIKYHYDEQKNEDYVKSYHIEKGLAGYVTISGHTIFVQNIDEDSRFNPEIDDPKVKNAKQVISVPIFCQSDRYEVGSDSLANLPRGIIQLINKTDPNGFSGRDIEKLEFLSSILGRCHDCVLKVEQLYSLKSVSDSLTEITKKVQNNLDTSCLQFGHMKKQFTQFIQTVNDRSKNNAAYLLNSSQGQSQRNLFGMQNTLQSQNTSTQENGRQVLSNKKITGNNFLGNQNTLSSISEL